MRSFVALSLVALLAAPLAAQTTKLVTSNADGNPCDSHTYTPWISDNGRYVTVTTESSDFLPGDDTDDDEAVVVDLQKGKRIRVAVNDEGEPANSGSAGRGTSANGRFAVFQSISSNLVPNDENGSIDVFVRDIKKGHTRRVSVSSTGEEGLSHSSFPRISANGRFVTFLSNASNLVPGDTLGSKDIFVHDLKTGLTERVSVSTAGAEGDDDCERPTISANGRWVAFVSFAENLVDDDNNGKPDVFVRDRKLGTTTRVSVTEAGGQLNGFYNVFESFISANGRFVAMATDAPGIDPVDQNGLTDIYVRDLKLGTMTLLSRGFDGSDADGESNPSTDSLAISGNGRWIVFGSDASNLVETGGAPGFTDVFLADRVKGTLALVSEGLAGAPCDEDSNECSVSSNGRVAFSSMASNLTETDLPGPEGSRDIFVRKMK